MKMYYMQIMFFFVFQKFYCYRFAYKSATFRLKRKSYYSCSYFSHSTSGIVTDLCSMISIVDCRDFYYEIPMTACSSWHGWQIPASNPDGVLHEFICIDDRIFVLLLSSSLFDFFSLVSLRFDVPVMFSFLFHVESSLNMHESTGT